MVTGYGPVERLVRLWLPVGFFLVLALFRSIGWRSHR
jgi:hypothetical protein